MKPVLETLMLPLVRGDIPLPERAAFMGARYHSLLEEFRDENLVLQQHFRPFAEELQSRGFNVKPVIESSLVPLVLALLPRNIDEARGLVAHSITILEEGGTFLCAAANDAGGGRIKKILEEFGLTGIANQSKNHARVVWGVKAATNEQAVKEALRTGGAQKILDGSLWSMPGLFSWDRVDKGSRLLAECLPDDLGGRGADFGCGYGWLARFLMDHSKGIEHLCCIDADARAIEMCKKNLAGFPHVDYLWADLTAPLSSPGGLDFIIMNPPFHEGKNADAGIGQHFIATAAQSLKKGGQLWMVANAHLPYEKALGDHFSVVEKIKEAQGFKIYKAML